VLIDEAVEVADQLISAGITSISIVYDPRQVSWKVTIEQFLFKKDIKFILGVADARKLEVEFKPADMAVDIYTPVGKPGE